MTDRVSVARQAVWDAASELESAAMDAAHPLTRGGSHRVKEAWAEFRQAMTEFETAVKEAA